MEKALVKESRIYILKSKFFLIRALTYFGFLLLPVWVQKSLYLNQGIQVFIMILYALFICGQWFMLGKEIDHRLKIYFRVNSSIDRVVYRLYLGMFFFVLYFNMLSFLPDKWIYNCFWITWVILGLFYSWPTRGKIIEESVSTNFSEFRYLDSFEKTLVGLVLALLIFSMPELPRLNNQEALKLIFDPNDNISSQFWTFLKVSYYPFYRYPHLFKVAWTTYFYFVGTGLFLLTFYALLRYFVSRRLSLLGAFAFISSWGFSKVLVGDLGATIFQTYGILWIWAFLWVLKSSTYRTGLFLGLVGYYACILNRSWGILSLMLMALFFLISQKHNTKWFNKQIFRYMSFGMILTLISLSVDFRWGEPIAIVSIFEEIQHVLSRKAFYILAIFGLAVILLKSFVPKLKLLHGFKYDTSRFYQMILGYLLLLLFSITVDKTVFGYFHIQWMIVLLSLVPLELLFQTISKLRSSRNMIYLIYILICLLDSHFEGRVKIFLRIFSNASI